jgi:hypothetical protein
VASDWPVPLRADQPPGPSDLNRSEWSRSNVPIWFKVLIITVEIRLDGRGERGGRLPAKLGFRRGPRWVVDIGVDAGLLATNRDDDELQ